ncbi:MAG: bifunctional UDP-sugar hydrolase/5'-nucleotidase [Lachnospiraceae bacterium]|nr:bifunctional UDP-sugar hydrolase/5'-nucleotidase [Lachnospiraceae bacterium]
MKKSLKWIIAVFSALIVTITFSQNIYAAGEKSVDIVFSHDLHSYVEDYEKSVGGNQINIGGFARLKTFIDEKRRENPDVLVVDGGDIVMGTLPQVLVDTEAFELKMLASFGYDAITIGNHEFDYGAKALSDMYSVAGRDKARRPALVICNIDLNQNDEYTNTLKEGLTAYGYSDYTIVEKGGVKIAILGVLGYDAIKCAPTCKLTFIDPVEAVKSTVEKIKANEDVDMIMCLSHSGTGFELGKTEDELLAKAVPDLDVIISAHSHTVLNEQVTVGDTVIASCGSYGMYTGEMKLTQNESGRWNLDNYNLRLMDDSVAKDEDVLAAIEDINAAIDEIYLSKFDLKAEDVIAYNDGIAFESVDDCYDIHTEAKLGNLLSDAYRYSANKTPTGQNTRFDVAVTPAGTIRGSFPVGNITTAKAFEALSLGIGQDGVIGYPLVSLFLTGSELKTMCEVDASISDLMRSARLYTSGICFEYNPHRMLLSKVSDAWISSPLLEESRSELDNEKLYRVVTDYYSMSMLSAVTEMSKGLLSIVPKDENGNAIEDFNSAIIYDENGNELKAWIAVADYFKSFSQGSNGISTIPSYYDSYHSRKVVDSSFNPVKLFKNSSKFFYIFMVIIITLILLIVLIVRAIIKNKHRKKILIG